MSNTNKIKMESDPFFQGIIRKKPFDLLEAFTNLESYKIYELRDKGTKRAKDAYEAIQSDSNLIYAFEKFETYVTEGYNVETFQNISKVLSFFSIARTIQKDVEDEKDTSKKNDKIKKIKEKIEKNAKKLSSTIAIFAYYFQNIIESYYKQEQNELFGPPEIADGVGLFLLKMMRYGAFPRYVGETFMDQTRNNYVVFLPTYLAIYFDDYNRPEVIGSTYQELLITDARKPLRLKVMTDDSLVQKKSELTKETVSFWEKLKTELKSLDDNDNYPKFKSIINKPGITGDIDGGFPFFNTSRDIVALYYATESPTGVFVATTRSYTSTDAILENSLLTIVNSILKAMNADPMMTRLPQFNNPKIIQKSNEEKMKDFRNGTWQNKKISALYFVPVPETTTNLKFSIPEKEVKKIKKPEEFVSAKVIEASKCIFGEKCTNEEFAKAFGPLIQMKKEDPDNSEAVNLVKSFCKSVKNPASFETLRLTLGLPMIDGESDDAKCKRIEKAILKNIQS